MLAEYARENGTTARQRGLEQVYCTKQKGIEVGRAGETYEHVCPADLEPNFLVGYLQGQKIFYVEQKLSEVKDKIEEVEERLEDPNLSAESREIWTDRLSDLSHEAEQLEFELWELERNLL